jgi:hypothetical protein
MKLIKTKTTKEEYLPQKKNVTCSTFLPFPYQNKIKYQSETIEGKQYKVISLPYHQYTMRLYFFQTFSNFFKHKPSIPYLKSRNRVGL